MSADTVVTIGTITLSSGQVMTNTESVQSAKVVIRKK
jgi:hypothetical protein